MTINYEIAAGIHEDLDVEGRNISSYSSTNVDGKKQHLQGTQRGANTCQTYFTYQFENFKGRPEQENYCLEENQQEFSEVCVDGVCCENADGVEATTLDEELGDSEPQVVE